MNTTLQNPYHLTLSDFEYHLPQENIAQHPVYPKDHSRLLHLQRKQKTMEDLHFYDLPSLLKPTDVLVLNNSKTIPGRIFATKPTGGSIEFLFTKPLDQYAHNTTTDELWEALTKPGLKKGQIATISYRTTNGTESITVECVDDIGYSKKVLVKELKEPFINILKRAGKLPTPHYIHAPLTKDEDYQTIYAKKDGSAATPTAGLHFTDEVFKKLDEKGIPRIEITLHVGLGTFLPVKTEDISQHEMHAEWFTLTQEQVDQLNAYKKEGRRIIAVGTTSMRVLESCTDERGMLHAQTGETKLYVYPPYQFRFVDALITNFHLPKSTLLMLISAFCTQQEPFSSFAESFIGKAYEHAVKSGYRFYSLGDAMFIE